MKLEQFLQYKAIEILRGGNFKPCEKDQNNTVYILKVSDILETTQSDLQEQYTSQDILDKNSKLKIQKGDVVISIIAGSRESIGQVKYYPDQPKEPLIVSRSLNIFRVKESSMIVPEFLAYILKSSMFRTYLNSLKHSASTIHINKKIFENFTYDFPCIEQQAKCLEVLKKWDIALDLLEKDRDSIINIKEGLIQTTDMTSNGLN